MTHTLHRRAGADGLRDDFVIMAMPARGFNNDEKVVEKLQEFLAIFSRHNPNNMGAMGIGHLYESTPEQIIQKVYPELPMVHGVFRNREDVVAALKEIKAEDMGISIIVTGLVDAADCCAREAGLTRHSINYSLGIWGKTELLPDEKYLQITSMCGHAMISVNLVKKMIADVKKGVITLDQAAAELAKPCVCGIFNGARARGILEELM
ncbi:MAG TPA: hypothetical protein PKA10_01365 [Selenomonadales bacterium]|nr:hypothetical protein [Selenomonadales bacterium]